MKILFATAAIILALLLLLWPHAVSSHETLTTTVLFDREIVQVLNRHCVMCHFEKGPSFPLETYEQTWLRGRQIRASVIARHMPLWPAVSGYGQFANDNSLTLREMQFVVSWVEGLGPRNAGTVFTNIVDTEVRKKDVRAETNFSEWKFGTPDLRLEVPANTVESHQNDSIARVVIATGQSSERRLRAIEYIPGDRRVTRAVFFTIQETGQWIGSWTPWAGFSSLPGSAAYRLPAGAHIAAEIYYRGTAERVVDQGTLGLFYSDVAKAAAVSELTLSAKPAGVRKLRSEVRLDADSDLLALRPDWIPGVSSLEVLARRPDGGTDVLFFAKDFSMDWPTPFVFKDPVVLRKGTVLFLTATMTAATPSPLAFGLTINRLVH